MRTTGETRDKRIRLAAPAAMLAAMIFAGLPAHFSDGQTKSDPAALSPSDSVAPLQFDVISVKMHNPESRDSRMQLLPDGIRLSNLQLQDLIVQSYGLVLRDQIVGLPGWANSERFDMEAKVAGADVAAFRKLTLDQIRTMARPILADRFKFAGHEEKRVLPLYALVVAKEGSKLQPSTLSGGDRDARTGQIGMRHASSADGGAPGLNELTARGVTTDRLASTLSQQGLGPRCSRRHRPGRPVRFQADVGLAERCGRRQFGTFGTFHLYRSFGATWA